MTFQSEIFHGMFSTIIIIRPCKFMWICNLHDFVYYQFCNDRLNVLLMVNITALVRRALSGCDFFWNLYEVLNWIWVWVELNVVGQNEIIFLINKYYTSALWKKSAPVLSISNAYVQPTVAATMNIHEQMFK